MNLFGLSITRTKAAPVNLSGVDGSRSWWPLIRESFTGAWQQNVEVTVTDALTYPTAFACVVRIASDISKLAVLLTKPTEDDIWTEVENPAFSPVLRTPNHFQTHLQFYEYWMLSKLTRGNTYVLKIRDNRSVVTALYVLDPNRVQPLVAPNGDVFYQLNRDDLSRTPDELIVPAREIIHDRFNCLYHPLVGLSPLHAGGLNAIQGLRIQTNTANLFANGANPGGILTAPLHIPQETADRIKAYVDGSFQGAGVGKTLVLGDGMGYTPVMMNAVDSELVEQLKWSDEKLCSVFGVPAYMVGVGPYPSYNNVQALQQQYHSQCLQVHLESIERLLDEGLGLLPLGFRSMFDLNSLLRMDSATMMATIAQGVGAGVMKPNEGRNQLNLAAVTGGDTPYLQQQNYSLAALDARDKAAPAPSDTTPSTPEPEPEPEDEPEDEPVDDKAIGEMLQKALEELQAA